MAYAEALAEQPGKMIPELFTRKYDINATYDLLDEREVVLDAIQATHRRLVMAELRKRGRYLLIEDTTFPSFSHRKQPIPGLGPIGDSEPGQQGFLLHSILAVRADSLPVPDASGRRPGHDLRTGRPAIPRPYPPGSRHAEASRIAAAADPDRESDRWLESGKRIGRAPNNPEVRWVRVADREADIYEYMESCQKAGHGFVIRVSQNRILLNPADGKRLGLVFEHIVGVAAGGNVPGLARPRWPNSAASKAPDQLWSGARSRPERAGRAAGTGEPIDCWFVRIWEQDPPEGVEPLEWVLYTDWPTENFSDAIMAVMDYGTRFLIEEFHKGIKTGLRAEHLQLETGNRLFVAIAVMSVVALRLLHLRELVKASRKLPRHVLAWTSWDWRCSVWRSNANSRQ